MTFKILMVLSLAAHISFSSSRKLTPQNTPTVEISPRWIKIKDSAQNADKGSLFLDPVSCQFHLLKNDLKISLKDDNFLLEFPDGRTVIGVIKNTNPTKRPSCFHSLTAAPKSSLYRIRAIGMHNGMSNCLARETLSVENPAENLTDELAYIPTAQYNANCKKDSGACTNTERKVKISAIAGLVFYSLDGKQSGSNIRQVDLRFEERFRDQCDQKIKPTPTREPNIKAIGKTT